MKTKELIRRLQEADPSGDIECCVGNVDVFYVENMPAYYDGTLQVLTRDPAKAPYYDVVGGSYVRQGRKINIVTLAISSVLDDPDVIIDYSQIGHEDLVKRYKDSDDKTREQWKNIHVESEWSLFQQWAKTKAAEISGDPVCMFSARQWFDGNIDPKSPLKAAVPKKDEKHGYSFIPSYCDRRKEEWDETVTISTDGMDWIFSRKTL